MDKNCEIILLGSITKINESVFEMDLINYLNGKLIKKAILNVNKCRLGKSMLFSNASESVYLVKIFGHTHQDRFLTPKSFEVAGLIDGDGNFIS